MLQSPNLAKQYAKSMTWHGHGHALLRPVPIEAMKAPCAGYFDSRGEWHLITNLAGQPEDPQWKRNDYTFLREKPLCYSAEVLRWGPKPSEEVYEDKLGKDLGSGIRDLTALGMPLQLSMSARWRTKGDIGAFLVTSPPVVREKRQPLTLAPYKKWIKENLDTLLNNGRSAMLQHGLLFVTETCSTPQCLVQSWSGHRINVNLHPVAREVMAGEIVPPKRAEDMFRNDNDLELYAQNGYGGRVVVFCAGLFCKVKSWSNLKQKGRVQWADDWPDASSDDDTSDVLISAKGMRYHVSWSATAETKDTSRIKFQPTNEHYSDHPRYSDAESSQSAKLTSKIEFPTIDRHNSKLSPHFDAESSHLDTNTTPWERVRTFAPLPPRPAAEDPRWSFEMRCQYCRRGPKYSVYHRCRSCKTFVICDLCIQSGCCVSEKHRFDTFQFPGKEVVSDPFEVPSSDSSSGHGWPSRDRWSLVGPYKTRSAFLGSDAHGIRCRYCHRTGPRKMARYIKCEVCPNVVVCLRCLDKERKALCPNNASHTLEQSKWTDAFPDEGVE